MFAPRVAKPNVKTAAPSKNTSPLHPATPFGHRHNDGGEYLHMLQQPIGDQAVLRLSRRQGLLENKHGAPGQDISPESLSAEGGSRGLAWDFSKIPLFPPKRMSGEFQSPSQFPASRLPEPIQTKLKVGAIDDPLEHEADRVAEQVMRMPSRETALTSVAPQVSRKCAECEEEVKLYKKGATAEAAVGHPPSSVHEALRSPGQPLDPATRGLMEPRFGRDFSGVRVHTDSAAAQSAREVNAHAYTVGHNVVFGSGQFAPRTNEGQKLLAHELTHVLQQKGSGDVIQKKDDKEDTASTGDKTKTDKISDEDLNTLAAIVATEANIGQEDDIEWVYINLHAKGTSSLDESTPYRTKADTYKFNRYLLDDTYKGDQLKTAYFKNECRALKGAKNDKACDDLKTIADVYSTNESYYVGSNKKRVKKIREELVNKFNSPGSNPGFNSNGNLDDLNREDGEWPKIREYLRLQDADSKLPVLIKKMGEGKTFEVVYKKDQIMDFFKNRPDKLPKKVPQHP
jgi:Domain of unknown function (DUF4157)